MHLRQDTVQIDEQGPPGKKSGRGDRQGGGRPTTATLPRGADCAKKDKDEKGGNPNLLGIRRTVHQEKKGKSSGARRKTTQGVARGRGEKGC